MGTDQQLFSVPGNHRLPVNSCGKHRWIVGLLHGRSLLPSSLATVLWDHLNLQSTFSTYVIYPLSELHSASIGAKTYLSSEACKEARDIWRFPKIGLPSSHPV